TFESSFGPINVKEAEGYGTKCYSFEYEDLKRIALAEDQPIKDISKIIDQEWNEQT
ncbi:MAG TPA: hypothetical protein GX717_08290, partial [Clostridiaceae bacterium]|nr:hypothetical protein [Clostridiaceae bacterium]